MRIKAATLVILLASALVTPPALTQTAARPAPAWPPAASGVPSDPAVRYGRLANGMRYAILKNATPPGEASLRLRIDAGSLNERDDQRGVAHFLEHMVLNGTKNVPEGEFVRRLERFGLRFGPDTNASTDFEQTLYKLDLPKADDATVGEALFLLREVADEASLDAKAIDSERGIILSEERTRATPGYRVALDENGYVLKGQRLPTRFPIGDTGVIAKAPRERFVEFYNGYYRPERATLIATGDFDVDAMERKIRERFASWKGEGPALADADQGTVAPRGREARLYVQPGVPTRVSVSWLRPADLRPDSAVLSREGIIESLAMRVLNRRLERIATEANPPFIGAGGGSSADAESAERTSVAAIAGPGKWADALSAITREQRRLAQFGVTQAELDREVAELRTAYASGAAGAATRNSRALADALVGAVNEDNVFSTPASQLARFEEVSKGLTAATVNGAVRRLFSGQGPLLYMTSPVAIPGDDAALLTAYDAAAKVPVTAPTAVAAKAWPYQSFGTPGRVVDRREIGDGVGATAVRFANGTRLTVKKTAFKDDEILVTARFGGGRLDFANDGRPTPLWSVGSAVTEGGLGKLTWEEVRQTLTPNVASVGFGVDDDRFTLGGSTRPEDFALQMKLLAAYYTDPAWRPTGWDRSRAISGTIHDSLEATPGGVFGRDAQFLLTSRDSRYALPNRAEMAAMEVGAARGVLAPRFGRGPAEIIIVGDIDVDEAIRQVAATFAALPTTAAAPPATPPVLRFPAATAQPVRITHKGRDDQGLAFIAWPTTGYFADLKRARTLNLLADVLQLRLIDEIREKQGTTYSPSAGHSASETFADYGYMSASIQAPPDKLAGFLADAERIARSLRDTPITADELDRARKPRLAGVLRSRNSSNAWWLGNLNNVQTDPRVAVELRTQVADYEAVTPADLQRLARQYLVDARDWKLIVVPEAKPAQASSGAPATR